MAEVAIEKRFDVAFASAYGRSAKPNEIEMCRRHFQRSLSRHREDMLKPVALPTHVRRGMIEEFTGEMVYWDEELPLADYQRDTMPWEVTPDIRALADVCLVILNSNEFMYVR